MALNAEVQAAVAAIDRCLDKHIVHSNVHVALRGLRRYGDGAAGFEHVSWDQVQALMPLVAEELNVPKWVFADLDHQIFSMFDCDENGLDEDEFKRMIKKLLQIKRIHLGGRRPVKVPVMTVPESGYTVGKELGKGGQGTMYLATKRSWESWFFTKEYCIKFYEKACANAGGLDDLLDEYALMLELNDPGIAKTYAVFQDTKFYYLVNEPYFGGDLTKLAKHAFDNKVRMSEAWWRGIFQQSLAGLKYLHEKGVMHCDIKEPNIMIAKADTYASPQPVLIDFGLSSAFTAKREGVCGTPGYIPPETWDSGHWYTRGDVFSMGVVFFQMVTGQVPSKNGAVKGILTPPRGDDYAGYSLNGHEAFPWDLFPGDMHGLADLVTWMTDSDRSQRPKSLRALTHPWFAETTDRVLPPENLQLLLGIATGHKMQEQLVTKLGESNNLDQLRALQSKFQKADKSGRGVVEGNAAVRLLSTHGVQASVAHEIVTAAGGSLPYQALTNEAISAKEDHGYHFIKDLFDALDVDKSGKLSRSELRGLLTSEAFHGPREEREQLVEWMQPDNRGEVCFDNFAHACLRRGNIANRSEVVKTDIGKLAASAKAAPSAQSKGVQSSYKTASSRAPNFEPQGSSLPYKVAGRQGAMDTDLSGYAGSQAPPLRPIDDPFESRGNWDDPDPMYPSDDRHVFVTIISASGLRDRWPVVHCNPYVTCRRENATWPEFETHVVHNNGSPSWNREQAISAEAIGDTLEFLVWSKATPGGLTDDELIGIAALRREQYLPYGLDSEVTILGPGTGIRGLLRLRIVVVEEGHASSGPHAPGFMEPSLPSWQQQQPLHMPAMMPGRPPASPYVSELPRQIPGRPIRSPNAPATYRPGPSMQAVPQHMGVSAMEQVHDPSPYISRMLQMPAAYAQPAPQPIPNAAVGRVYDSSPYANFSYGNQFVHERRLPTQQSAYSSVSAGYAS